jgi:hypothetical protein
MNIGGFWPVEDVLGMEMRKGKPFYLIKWLNFSE